MVLESIAFIPDGNRRFAASQGTNLPKAYSAGTEKALQVIDWLQDYPDIKVGTFYTLSLENLSRSKAELAVLFKMFEGQLQRFKADDFQFFNDRNIQLKFIGRTELMPEKLQGLMKKAEALTAHNKKRTINLAVAYNGQQEIVDACKKIAQNYASNGLTLDKIDVSYFTQYLYSQAKFPDLIVRTSGEERLSAFLTFQSAYSELYFVKKYWPELSRNDLKRAVETYNTRHRKFGK